MPAKYINVDNILTLLASIDTQIYAGGDAIGRDCVLQDKLNNICSQIEQMPTADVVEVVRCRDCKWADWYKTEIGDQYCYCLELGTAANSAEDYCSYAERRVEDAKIH